jgi:hypothetical protein
MQKLFHQITRIIEGTKVDDEVITGLRDEIKVSRTILIAYSSCR